MRYAQLVVGPAGSGKSTYCSAMIQHGVDNKRTIEVVNLDPATEYINYNPIVDIRDLIKVQDAMEDPELRFGPNGGLIFCMEYLVQNADWLHDQLGEMEDDYILFDCPGQIELYTHLTVFKKLIELLNSWNFNLCTVYLADAQFMAESSKFVSGTMAALTVMINLATPHFNLISKMDLIGKGAKKQLEKYFIPDVHELLGDMEANYSRFNQKHAELTEAIGELIKDYGIVQFIPLNLKDMENVTDVLIMIDNMLQYDESLECKTKDFEEPDPDEKGG